MGEDDYQVGVSTTLQANEDMNQELGLTEDSLIFPVNITDSLKATKMKKSDKNGIILSFWIAGCLIVAWFLLSWLSELIPKYAIWIVFGVELLLNGTIGMVILRIVLDEKALIREASQDKTFSQYFGIQREILTGESSKYPFDMIEMVDGSYLIMIGFKLGYNTSRVSDNTYEANIQMQKILNKRGIGHRWVYIREVFSQSEAASNMRNELGNIKDPKLFKYYRDIVSNVLDIADNESNVVAPYLQLYARTQIEKDEIVSLVEQLLGLFKVNETVYREVSVLTFDQMRDFFLNYYALSAIDMGAVRLKNVVKKHGNQHGLRVLKAYGKSGKIFSTDDYENLRDEMLGNSGLKQVSGLKFD